jgi:hypothetical protein
MSQPEHDAFPLYCGGSRIGHIQPFASDTLCALDSVRLIEDGIYEVTRRFRVLASASVAAAHLTLDVVAEHATGYAMIPGVSYNGNPWGSGHDPKGFTINGEPWTFASHRTAIRGGTYAEGPDYSVALFARCDHPDIGCACALIPGDETTTHRLIWPEEEQSLTYDGRDHYAPGYRQLLALAPGDEVVVVACIVAQPLPQPCAGWHRFFDFAWQQNRLHVAARPALTPDETWRLGVQFARESLWAEEGVFRGFSIGLTLIDGEWRQRPTGKYEIGWCGQNAALANALLADHLRTGAPESLQKGLATLDTWATHARLENGLFRCQFDPLLAGEASREVQDTCNLGWAAIEFFDAFDLARRCGAGRPAYLATAYGICDFFVAHQYDDGCFGKAWTNAGDCVDREGTIGAFILPPLLEAYRRTQQPAYLAAARRGFDFYMSGLLRDGFTTAGALDTHCIDKESAIPLLNAGLRLFELTSERPFLDQAEHAAYYLASWQYHHSVAFPKGSPLEMLGYDTFGGTVVSTQHHHIDPYGIAFVPGWLRLAELTQKPMWRERALAVWQNGLQGISDGTLAILGQQRPAGGQDEAFFQTRWHTFGSVSEWLVAWPTAFRLETLRKLQDWSVVAS